MKIVNECRPNSRRLWPANLKRPAACYPGYAANVAGVKENGKKINVEAKK
jgi:hypothetical protein